MNGVIGSVLAFIVAISLLVAVHEFGHFWVAKRLGIKVLRFSIGFGKPFWSTRFGKDRTEFALAAIPLGGYVKMLDEREAPVNSAEIGRAFNRQPLWVRSAVLLAGPLFNFLFAIFAYWLMFVSGAPGIRPVIGEIEPGSYAQQAGFQQQDELLQINARNTPTWDAAILELLDAALAGSQVEVQVLSSDRQQRIIRLDFDDVPDALDKGGLLKNLGLSVWRPRIPAVIDRVVEAAPADLAGMQAGDRVVEVDGLAIDSWSQWVDYVRARPDNVLRVLVERDADRLVLEMKPRPIVSDGDTIGQIGAYVRTPENIMAAMKTEVRYGPVEAIGKSLHKTWDMSALTVRTLWGMISGRASVENISGPISIAQYAGYSARVGLASFLKFLAVVSISLGVLNLLPVPVLDGGHLLYNAIEWVKGKPLSDSAQQFGQQLGIAALLALMSIAFYNDLSRLFAGG